MKRIWLFMALILVSSVFAQSNDQVISMKTNEKVTATFILENVEQDTLKECFVFFSSELRDLPWVYMDPVRFDLDPGQTQPIDVVFEYPQDKGYYVDELQISCERWYEGQFVERTQVLSSKDAPDYTVLVSIAGEGQSYVLKPQDPSWSFVAKENERKEATITVANTGDVSLPLKIILPTETGFSVVPDKTIVEPGEYKDLKFTYVAPQNFDGIDTEIVMTIGDYKVEVPVEGKTGFGGFFSGGLFSVAGSDVEIGETKIPINVAIGFFIVLGGVYYYIFSYSDD